MFNRNIKMFNEVQKVNRDVLSMLPTAICDSITNYIIDLEQSKLKDALWGELMAKIEEPNTVKTYKFIHKQRDMPDEEFLDSGTHFMFYINNKTVFHLKQRGRLLQTIDDREPKFYLGYKITVKQMKDILKLNGITVRKNIHKNELIKLFMYL